MNRLFVASALAAAALASACATPVAPRDYTEFRAANPRSILVVPALNNTVAVEAPDFFLSTVSRPFSERGYYVFPAYMVKRLLEDDGLSDAGLVHSADASRFGDLFGCDAVLFVNIDRWESQYALIATSTNVEFGYVLKSCHDGATLWDTRSIMTYSPQANSSGNPLADIIAQAIVSAIEKAAPNYIPLAQMANLQAAATVGHGLPAGPYLPEQYGADSAEFPAR